MKTDTCDLYFLIAKDYRRFKIGISKNAEHRWKGIGSLTDLDLYRSNVTTFPSEKEAHKAEQFLHFLLEINRVEAPRNDKGGHTEWFNYSCYETAVTELQNIVLRRQNLDPHKLPRKRTPKAKTTVPASSSNNGPSSEREAREKAAIRILIQGLPGSPGGVGPVVRLVDKRRLVKEKWEQRKQRRATAKEATQNATHR